MASANCGSNTLGTFQSRSPPRSLVPLSFEFLVASSSNFPPFFSSAIMPFAWSSVSSRMWRALYSLSPVCAFARSYSFCTSSSVIGCLRTQSRIYALTRISCRARSSWVSTSAVFAIPARCASCATTSRFTSSSRTMARVWSLSAVPRAACCCIMKSIRERGTATPFTVATAPALATGFAAGFAAGLAPSFGSAWARARAGAASRATASVRIFIGFLSVLRDCAPRGAAGCARPRSLLLFDVPGEEQRLHDHEDQHQAHAAEQLEIDPQVGGIVVGHVQVRGAHESEESDPAPVEPRPHRLGQLHLLRQHRADQVPAEQERRAGQHRAKQPVEHRRLPLDEGLVLQQQGGAAEHRDDAQARPQHGLDAAPRQLQPAHLRERRRDRDRGGDVDVTRLA